MSRLLHILASAALVPAGVSTAASPTNDSDLFGETSWEHAPTEYVTPPGLVRGGAFIDRILPMPVKPGDLRSDVWGDANVKPRNVNNGIEDPDWSYWCRSVFKEKSDGKYHIFGARWPEDHPKGFDGWSSSRVWHGVADSPLGPFKVVENDIGHGHNVTTFRAKDGSYVIGIIYGGYIGPTVNGPWKERKIPFDNRGSHCPDDSNNTYTSREDGSVVMINQPGRVWISEDGLKPFRLVTNAHGGHPCTSGIFEDPIIWRDEVQYNVIFNDWYGRTAFYLRSKDGVKWVWDQGVAYDITVAKHPDGTRERWYKYERPSVCTDEFGRATTIYFAVLDSRKDHDKSNDNHTTKNIALPLVVPRRMEIVGTEPVFEAKTIRVRIKAEPGFSPRKDLNLRSLKFGAPSAVDFGKGLAATGMEPAGEDIIVTFTGASAGFNKEDFVGKMSGTTSRDTLAFGFARLPGVSFNDPILDANRPALRDDKAVFTVENFGMVASAPGKITATLSTGTTHIQDVPAIPAYGHTEVALPFDLKLVRPGDCLRADFRIEGGGEPFTLTQSFQNLTGTNGNTADLTLPASAGAAPAGIYVVAGKSFGKGIAVRSPSTNTWLLDGTWEKLSFTVGALKEAVGGSTVEVWGDGKRLWQSNLLRPKSIYNELHPVSISVKGVRSLSLISNRFFAIDQADTHPAHIFFAEPKLTRTTVHGGTSLEIGGWEPAKVSQEWKELEWPVPFGKLAALKSVSFRFTDGNHRFDIRKVELLADGKVLASSDQSGTANTPENPVIYPLAVPSGAKAESSCVIRASVRTDGGTNSTGAVSIILQKP